MRRFLSLLEGTTATLTVQRSALEVRVTPEVLAALRSAGLVRAAAACRRWPCDERRRGCEREVLENAPSLGKPFVAVCEGSYEGEDPCAAIELTADEIAQESVSAVELARLVQRVYGLEGAAPKSSGLGLEPVALGVEQMDGEPRDVFLAMSHADRALPLFLALRERAPRPTLVLVATARGLPPETETRYAPGAHVEVEALENALAIRDGKIVKGTRLRLVPAVKGRGPRKGETEAMTPGIAAEIGATSFREIRMTAVDGHTVRISCGKKSIRRTYRDLGMHAGNTREPVKQWDILMAVLAGHGSFRWKRFGDFGAVSTAMTRLRKMLRVAFGLREDPFHPHHSVEGWKAKFWASSEIGGDEG